MISIKKELRKIISLLLLRLSMYVMPNSKFKAQLVFLTGANVRKIDDDIPSWLNPIELQEVLILYNQRTNNGIKVLKHIAVLKKAPLDKYNLKWCRTFLREITNK